MNNACIRQGLILATLAALASGCSTWEGPRAKVEDRRVPGADRTKAVASKAPKRTEKPQREERQAVKEPANLNAKNAESPGAHAIADAVSSDQVVDMKPDKYPSRSSR